MRNQKFVKTLLKMTTLSDRMKYELIHSDKLTINIDSTDEESIEMSDVENGHGHGHGHGHGGDEGHVHNHSNQDDYGYTQDQIKEKLQISITKHMKKKDTKMSV